MGILLWSVLSNSFKSETPIALTSKFLPLNSICTLYETLKNPHTYLAQINRSKKIITILAATLCFATNLPTVQVCKSYGG